MLADAQEGPRGSRRESRHESRRESRRQSRRESQARRASQNDSDVAEPRDSDIEEGLLANNESFAILQSSCKLLPREIRVNFVMKVYGIVMYMLLLSSATALPFVIYQEKALDWITKKHPVVLGIVGTLFIGQYLFNLCMVASMICGNTACFKYYIKMFKTVPWNYLYLTVTALTFGCLIGIICLQYEAASVGIVFCVTLALVLCLTAYAYFTKSDFTGYGMYIFVLILGLCLTSLVAAFFPYDSLAHRCIGGLGAMVFGFVIVYDTQLIFGEVRSNRTQLEYTIDMYAFAAYQLYLDVINLFLYLLQAMGERRR